MNLDKLTFAEIKQLLCVFNNPDTDKNSHINGKYCVIRTYSAGVHIGIVEYINGTEVYLRNARRIWSWKGAFTLNEVATNGINKDSKLSATVNNILLTQAIEIIPASQKAINIFAEILADEP